MKKIGILSDTHGYWDDKYVQYFKDCDEIWHAGDIGDYTIIERLKEICPVVRAVRGNIDHGMVARKCPELEIFTCEGANVLLTHIGGYPGKWSPGMKKLLKENAIDLMVDGHSHILKVMPDRELDLLHINPGAAGQQGWHKVRTLITIIIDKEAPSEQRFRDLTVIELSNS